MLVSMIWYYPASLPASMAYVSKSVQPLQPRTCGSVLVIEYAGSGERLEWMSSRDCGPKGTKCYENGFPGYDFELTPQQSAVINGRRVFFSIGNHGSNAWACIPTSTHGHLDMLVVGIWESNFLTPREAMNLVAHATLKQGAIR